tara:strand:+ start:1663 stop:2028 length:366 start_codon:yes stop_codon:yes gene_type:complete
MSNGLRFSGRRIRTLDRENLAENTKHYEQYLEERKIKRMRHYLTPVSTLRRPTVDQMTTLDLIGHTWTTGDRLYKLADQYYDDPSLWWVIAWFNRAPTEAHLKVGDFVHIPLPLERVLSFM